MPTINWLFATLVVFLLCGLAVVAPFLLGMVAN